MAQSLCSKDLSAVWFQIVMDSWRDETLTKDLLENPRLVFEKYGVQLSEKVKVHVHKNSPSHFNFVLPCLPKGLQLEKEGLNKFSKLYSGGYYENITATSEGANITLVGEGNESVDAIATVSSGNSVPFTISIGPGSF